MSGGSGLRPLLLGTPGATAGRSVGEPASYHDGSRMTIVNEGGTIIIRGRERRNMTADQRYLDDIASALRNEKERRRRREW